MKLVKKEGGRGKRCLFFTWVPAKAATAGRNLVSSPFPTWPAQGGRASAVPAPAGTARSAQKELVTKRSPLKREKKKKKSLSKEV